MAGQQIERPLGLAFAILDNGYAQQALVAGLVTCGSKARPDLVLEADRPPRQDGGERTHVVLAVAAIHA